MFNKIKYAIAIFAIFMSAYLVAEDKDADKEIIPKLIKLSVKKISKTRKIKSKEQFPKTEGGIDYQHDDKTDHVCITVNIENKNKVSLKNFKIVALVYGKSVTEKRAAPEIHSEFTEPINDLKFRGKFKKEFTCSMTYDKSDDTLEKEAEEEGKDAKRFTTKAFGTSFYGYRVDIVNPEGKILLTSTWPGGLAKVLKKADKQKAK